MVPVRNGFEKSDAIDLGWKGSALMAARLCSGRAGGSLELEGGCGGNFPLKGGGRWLTLQAFCMAAMV